ncbi:hypothetical protein ACLFMI_00560 [Pseudonocardia nantongensis]|uniref:hypothetical protein n=1 Tax=Pseudonocardia nantongensis TaxID=1181885 RepID=UPI003979C491
MADRARPEQPDAHHGGPGRGAPGLSDDEFDDLLARTAETLAPFLELGADPGRTRRLVSAVVVPAT